MHYKAPCISQKESGPVFLLEMSVCEMIQQGTWEVTRCNTSKALCNTFWLFPPPSSLEKKKMWRDMVKGTEVHTGPKRCQRCHKNTDLDSFGIYIVWQSIHTFGYNLLHFCPVTRPFTRGAGWPAAVASTALYVLRGDEGQGKPTWLRLSAEGTPLTDQGQPPRWDSQQKRKQKAHMVHMLLAFLGLTWSLKSAGKQSWGGKLLQK